jgi:glycosyltransferase involved in cell wall biosynthesis
MNNEKETLVILTPGFPENEADSTCLPMQQQFVKSLKELYPLLNIIILSFQYPYLKKKYIWLDTTVISFDGRNKGGLQRLLLRQKLYSTLKKISKENKITGLLSFWYGECALVGKRFADKKGFKHYCWIMGQDARKDNKYPLKIQLRADELIALSDFLRDEFEKKHGLRPEYVIPFGTEAKQFNANTKERDIDILAAGSLIPLKQYDIFLEIVAEIKKQLPGIKAMLAGNGPEKDKLRTLIIKFGLQPAVTLTGELPHPEVLQLMQRTKVFLHPSSYEGFSGVCLEALSAGAQVISFCRAMNQEIEHWHIVRTKKEMKQKTLDFLQDPATGHFPVFPFLMSGSVKAVMRLFDYGK